MLSKVAFSTIFWVIGMTEPEIEPQSPGSLASTLTIMTMSEFNINLLFAHSEVDTNIIKL